MDDTQACFAKRKINHLMFIGNIFLILTTLILTTILVLGCLESGMKFLNRWYIWFPILYLIFGNLSSLFTIIFYHIPVPEGIEINAPDHPELFDVISGVSKELNFDKAVKVIIDYSFNASVLKRKTRAYFGKNEYYLCIGLPLMAALNEREFRALIFHELSHLHQKHFLLSEKVVREYEAWEGYINKFREKTPLYLIIQKKFSDWYFPRLNHYYLIVCREYECQADQVSCKYSSPDDIASLLIRIALYEKFIVEEFYEKIDKLSYQIPAVPNCVISDLIGDIRKNMNRVYTKGRMEQVLSLDSSDDDTHLSTRERVKLYVARPVMPEPVEDDLINRYLCRASQYILSKLDIMARNDYSGLWNEHRDRINQLKKQYMQITEKKEKEITGLELDMTGDYFSTSNQVPEAIEAYMQAYEKSSFLYAAKAQAGYLMIKNGRPEGEKLILDVVKAGVTDSLAAYSMLIDYYYLNDRVDEAKILEDEYSIFTEELNRWWEEEISFNNLKKHDLDHDTVETIKRLVLAEEREKFIKRIYIVKVCNETLPTLYSYGIFYVSRTSFSGLGEENNIENALEAVPIIGKGIHLNHDDIFMRLEEDVRGLENSLIYEKNDL